MDFSRTISTVTVGAALALTACGSDDSPQLADGDCELLVTAFSDANVDREQRYFDLYQRHLAYTELDGNHPDAGFGPWADAHAELIDGLDDASDANWDADDRTGLFADRDPAAEMAVEARYGLAMADLLTEPVTDTAFADAAAEQCGTDGLLALDQPPAEQVGPDSAMLDEAPGAADLVLATTERHAAGDSAGACGELGDAIEGLDAGMYGQANDVLGAGGLCRLSADGHTAAQVRVVIGRDPGGGTADTTVYDPDAGAAVYITVDPAHADADDIAAQLAR
jgi:hypothetical protein